MSIRILTSNKETKDKIINMCDMKPLECGYIIESTDSDYLGLLVIRTASIHNFEVMQIDNVEPGHCWSSEPPESLKVRLLNRGEKVTLQIEGDV